MPSSDNCTPSTPPSTSLLSPPVRARMPHVASSTSQARVQLCPGLHLSAIRGLMLVNDFGGPVSMSNWDQQLGTATQHMCRRRFARHPAAFHHVIGYPTIYNCIKTHTYTHLELEHDLSRQRLFPATAIDTLTRPSA